MNTIKVQMDYFKQNEQQIKSDYSGKVVVIGADLSLNSYDTPQIAYENGVKLFGYGSFMIKDLRDNKANSINMVNPSITTTL